jgi:hypothetical protein
LRVRTISFLIFFLFCKALSAQNSGGTICVVPNSPEPPTRISPGGYYNPATLLVKIDKRDAVPWPHKKSIKIEGLDLKKRHLVVLTSDGKPIQSFWFRFSGYNLCVSFDGYQGVQLQNADGHPGCKCQ